MKLHILVYTLLAISTLASCDKSDDTISELNFSVDGYEVYTDDIEYSFDILSGGGNYSAEICSINEYDKYATATVLGKRVHVKLVSEATKIQVTDKYGQHKDLIIRSSNKSLQMISHDIAIGYGFQLKSKFEWGSGGGYSILETIYPGFTELILKENGEYVANSLLSGRTTAFIVRDSRGTINYVKVSSLTGWDLNTNELEVTIEAAYQYTFIIKWGEGKVKISDCSEELKNHWQLIAEKNEYRKYEVLQICANKGSSGQLFVELTDAANNKAKITLNIQ